MSLNANALVALDDLKGYIGEQGTASDPQFELVINSVSQEFDRFCGRILKQTTYTNLYLDGSGEKYLFLPSWPAASVTGVYEDDDLLVEGTDEDYIVVTSDDEAYLLKTGTTWPELDEEVATWYEGPQTILISSIKLGYATIPADIQLACLKQCAVEVQRMKQKTWGESSRSVTDGAVSFVAPGLLPDVEAVLKRYQRKVI